MKISTNEIVDSASLVAWLEGRRAEKKQRETILLASRIAFRVFPFLFHKQKGRLLLRQKSEQIKYVCWRNIILCSAAEDLDSNSLSIISHANAEIATYFETSDLLQATVAMTSRAALFAAISTSGEGMRDVIHQSQKVAQAYEAISGVDISSALWENVRSDALRLELGSGNLRPFPIWNVEPYWWENATRKIAISQSSSAQSGYSNELWKQWHQAISMGLPPFGLHSWTAAMALEKTIVLGSKNGKFHPEFWDRELDEINRDVEEWVLEAQAVEAGPTLLATNTIEELEPRPAGYYFQNVNGRIAASYAGGSTQHLDFANETRDALIEKLRASATRLRMTQVRNHFPDMMDQIAEKLSQQNLSVSAGMLLSQYRSWQTCLAELNGMNLAQEAGEDVPAILGDAQSTFEDYLATMPEIAKIEASRLALRLQNDDAIVVNQSLFEISVAAEASDVVDETARAALRDLYEEVSRLGEVINKSADHDAVTKAIETRGTIVGQRARTAGEFARAVVGRTTKAAGAGYDKAIADVTEAGIKVAVVSLVGKLTGPLLAIASVVLMFKPLAKKAEEASKTDDPPDDLTPA